MKKLMTLLAIGALGAFAATSATAGNGDKVTGGGQTLIGAQGAGNTIAFTAQGTVNAAKGQVQVVDRTAGKGKNQVKFHGVVDCVEVTGTYGIVGGHRKGSPADRFDLRVIDNGEGAGASEPDMIAFDRNNPDVECGDEDADNAEPDIALARGNAQVRDGDSTNP